MWSVYQREQGLDLMINEHKKINNVQEWEEYCKENKDCNNRISNPFLWRPAKFPFIVYITGNYWNFYSEIKYETHFIEFEELKEISREIRLKEIKERIGPSERESKKVVKLAGIIYLESENKTHHLIGDDGYYYGHYMADDLLHNFGENKHVEIIVREIDRQCTL